MSCSCTRYNTLLADRFKLPPSRQAISQAPGPGPDEDRNPGFLSTEVFSNDESGTGVLLRLRPAYYDVLDGTKSQVANSSLSMLDGTFALVDDRLSLRNLYLFKVEAVNGSMSGLPGDNGKTWMLAASLSQQNLACKDCLLARFEGNYGKSIPLGNSLFGLSLGGAIQENRNGQGAAYISTGAFANFIKSDRLRVRLNYESRNSVNGFNTEILKLQARYRLSKNSDIRVRMEKNEATEIGISLGYYW